MRYLLILTILFLTSCSQKQKTRDYLISYTDTTTGEELIGFKDKFGKIIIDAKYTHVYTDTLFSMAIVLKNGEWLGIDKEENVILKPFIFDNGPDYLEEGLFRFVENNKIGFADINGRKIISAKYDFATPFENGLSTYVLGGQREYDKGGEHWWWIGGYESGYINHDGKEFTQLTELKDNRRQAWTKDKKQFLLNSEGQIVKQLK
jgi:hypothetical protein